MTLSPHSPAWYDRLATLQTGYWYPWRSTLGQWNGEDEYLTLVNEQLGAAVDVLDAGCGHGEVALQLAPHCRSVLAYDRIESWIARAQATAQAQGVTNVTYCCYNSGSDANGGRPRLPAADQSIDLLISRRGPFHWIEDARRVARRGTTLIMLVPDARPKPRWNELLPEPLRWKHVPGDLHWARKAIEERLAVADLRLHSWWSFDVPEYFATPQDLYDMFHFGYAPGELPAYSEVEPALATIFAQFASSNGLELRHIRHLWKAVVV